MDTSDQYRMIRGGVMIGTGGDATDEVADYSFERLVVGDYASAMERAEGGRETMLSAVTLGDEVEDALDTRHILVSADEPDVFVTVKYPVRRRPPIEGRESSDLLPRLRTGERPSHGHGGGRHDRPQVQDSA